MTAYAATRMSMRLSLGPAAPSPGIECRAGGETVSGGAANEPIEVADAVPSLLDGAMTTRTVRIAMIVAWLRPGWSLFVAQTVDP
ncbi:hypothetical protein GCM10009776_16660 [Microbacterium deminutum]|uniref:Uncharacterized protein n=1 Tax=Microbacterium deminutum TaxID=344164 RepID=A0ABN2QNK7_9MICO